LSSSTSVLIHRLLVDLAAGLEGLSLKLTWGFWAGAKHARFGPSSVDVSCDILSPHQGQGVGPGESLATN